VRSPARLPTLALLLAPTVASAQTPDHVAARDSEGATGSLVRAVAVESRDVFDITPESPWYARLMNRLHVTTREGVIRRELLLRPGEPYDSARAAESERNLRGLRAFRSVHVDSVRGDSGLAVRVVTADAWTTSPYFTIRTSGSQAVWGAGVTEDNLLGRLISAGVLFTHEPDRNALQLLLGAPRIIADRVGVAASYADLTDGRSAAFETGLPFLSLSARKALTVGAQTFDGRVLRYTNGDPVPSDSLHRRVAVVRLVAGHAPRASPRGYLRLGLTGQLRREDFASQPPPHGLPRTVTGAVLVTAEARRASYIVTQNYRDIGPQEDVDLSPTLRLGASLAPRQWGYEHTGVGPLLNVNVGRAFAHGFSILQAGASTLYGGAGLDSGTFTLASTTVFQWGSRQTGVLYVGGGRQVNPYPGAEFDLGLIRGPRAFPQHAFTGDRYFFGSAEYRWTAIPELMQLFGIGLAGFVDYGGAWFGGSPRRTGTDVGLGLRWGSARFPSVTGATRVDLAYRFGNDAHRSGWVLVLGTGFVFETAR
jgi:hypothetical protein